VTELHVATTFSRFLGGRVPSDGPWSGAEFRDKHLRPAVERALATGEALRVVFDGVAGMPTSFLEEAFGGLLRTMPGVALEQIQAVLRLDASDQELWPFIKLAERYMEQQAARAH